MKSITSIALLVIPRFLKGLVGSDAVIAAAIVMHLTEGTIFLTTRSADGTIGMAALLATFATPGRTALVVYAAAICGAIGLWTPRLSFDARLTLMMGQFSLLAITGMAALYAVLQQSYADGVPRPWQFIICDQFARLGAPALYLLAIFARAARVGV